MNIFQKNRPISPGPHGFGKLLGVEMLNIVVIEMELPLETKGNQATDDQPLGKSCFPRSNWSRDDNTNGVATPHPYGGFAP